MSPAFEVRYLIMVRMVMLVLQTRVYLHVAHQMLGHEKIEQWVVKHFLGHLYISRSYPNHWIHS